MNSEASSSTGTQLPKAATGLVWWLTLALGLLLIPHGLKLMPTFPAAGYGSTEAFGGPVYAFEFARTPADLLAVFGPAGDAQQHGRISAMRRGTLLDFPFLAHYAAYLVAFGLGLRRTDRTYAWRLFVGGGVVAGVGDAVENALLLKLLDDLGNVALLGWLPFPVYAKFLAISLCCCLAGAAMLKAGGLLRLLGSLTLIAGVAAAAATLRPGTTGALIGPAITLAWVLMLTFAAWQVAAGRKGLR